MQTGILRHICVSDKKGIAKREVPAATALPSRAIAATRRGTLIINVPGSLRSSVENFQAIRAALPHALRMLRGDGSHPEQDSGRLVAIKAS